MSDVATYKQAMDRFKGSGDRQIIMSCAVRDGLPLSDVTDLIAYAHANAGEPTVMKPEEAAAYLRSRSISIATDTIRKGIDQGVLPFGHRIITGYKSPVYHINGNKLKDWADSFIFTEVRLETDQQ